MKFGEFIRADICQVAVQQVPAHKATLYHRRRKVAEKRLHECKGHSWGTAETLSCMYTSSYAVTSTCMGGVLLCLFFHCLFRKWRRHKGAHPNALRYVSRALAVYFKISGKVCKIWRRSKRALDRKIFRLKIWCLVRYYLLYGKLYRAKKRLKKWLTPLIHRVKSAYMRGALSVYRHLPPLRVSAVVIFLGLFMSGNVELNPGPKEGQLAIADLKIIRRAVWEARTQWMNIGIELNILKTDLDAIKMTNQGGNPGDCLTEMLSLWLKQVNPSPTWTGLITALKQPTISLEQLAEQIESNMHISAKESFGLFAEVTKLSFPHIKEVAPDERSREELEHRLRMETKDIMQDFHVLRNKLFDSIEEQKIAVEKLVEYLEDEVSDLLAQRDINSELLTLKEVKQIIKQNTSFYDYQLIKYMIKLTGKEEDNDRLEKYEKAFSAYAERRVIECPSVFSTSDDHITRSELHVKLDSMYDKCKLEELKDLQYRLWSILKVSVYVCRLKSVEKGCFLLTFFIPHDLQNAIFPLSVEQENALLELGVRKLTSGIYQFPRCQQNYSLTDIESDDNCDDFSPEGTSSTSTSLEDIGEFRNVEQSELILDGDTSKNKRRSYIDFEILRSERRRQVGRSAASSDSCYSLLASRRESPRMSSSPSPDTEPIIRNVMEPPLNQSILLSPDLLVAAANGDELRVAILINLHHVDVSYKDSKGNSALHYATENGHLKVVMYLIEQGADITGRDQNGMTLLHTASKFGHMHIIHYLVEKHNFNPCCFDHYKRTPFIVACMYNHLEIAQYFLSTLLKYETLEEIINSVDASDENVIHTTCKMGHIEIVRWLTSGLNCDSNKLIVPNSIKRLPLHYAAEFGHVHIVKLLIENQGCNSSCTDSNGATPLLLASMNGHLDTVTYLTVDRHCNPEIGDNDNVTPLHIAAINGHYNVTKFLVSELNCDPNIRGWKQSRTPLHVAAREGHLCIVKYLIEEKHCNPSCQDANQVTPLHLASRSGRLDIVKYLTVDRNCDPAVRSKKNATPLHVAARNGHYEVVRFLISELNCDPNIQGWKTKATPLHDAAQEGHLDIVKYLIEDKGCDPSCQDIDQVTPLHLASLNGHLDIIRYLTVDRNCDPAVRHNGNATPLHVAARDGHYEVVRFLICELNCDPNIQGWKSETTPLHAAAQEGHLNIVKYLIKNKGCDPSCQNIHQVTPLHLASRNGHLGVVKFLISDMNCDPNVPSFRGMTPLHCAIHSGNINLIRYMFEDINCNLHALDNFATLLAVKSLPCFQYLCENHCDPTGRTILGETMLHFAAREDHCDIIDYLIEYYFNPNTPGWMNRTPLHYAAEYGHLDLLKHLISEYDCQPNVTDANGDTPLHFAALQGHLPIVEHLTMNFNCDPLQTDYYGNTPLHDAARNGHLKVVRFLVETLRCPTDTKGSCHMTPLEWAFFKQHFHVVKYLCQANTKMISSELNH